MNRNLIRSGKYILLALALPFLCKPVFAGDPSRQRLNESPRHHEWVSIPHGERAVRAFLVYPEIKEKATAVIVIHENRGLTDWVCSVADKLAEHGYIAVAPDLLSGMAPGGGNTNDFPDPNAAREAIYQLPRQQITADLNALFEYVTKLPAANGKAAVAGFCWGGQQTFLFAANHAGISAAYVFYGAPPGSKEEVAPISCPVYGFYGGNDARVNASLPDITKLMQEAGKVFEPVIYEDAGHGFMRAGEAADATEANKKARESGWARWLALLKTL